MIFLINRKTAVIFLIAFTVVMIYGLREKQDKVFFTTDLKPYVVVIDAGHGGEDPGAVSNYSGTKEKDISLKIAVCLKVMLEADGYSVIMTRDKDELYYTPGTTGILAKRRQDLSHRKMIIDESYAGAAISIHLNKFPQTQYYGAQTFYPPRTTEKEILTKSIGLARSIQAAFTDMDPTNKRVALEKKETIMIMKNVKAPIVLIECGFVSNPEEERNLRDEAYQKKIAAAIKSGLDDYFRK